MLTYGLVGDWLSRSVRRHLGRRNDVLQSDAYVARIAPVDHAHHHLTRIGAPHRNGCTVVTIEHGTVRNRVPSMLFQGDGSMESSRLYGWYELATICTT